MFHTNESSDNRMVPLTICRTNGGPYDDAAFESGWRLGDIDATLAGPSVSALATSIEPAELHQADLIAMARGYAMAVHTTSDPGWLSVTFTRIDEDEL